MKSGKRKLKIYKKCIGRRYGQFVQLPEIRLCGVWLNNAGFEAGNNIFIEYSEDKIIISLEKRGENEQ
jgi:hypothetical protein